MCQAPNHIQRHLPKLNEAIYHQRRQLRVAQIVRLLRQSPDSHWSQLNSLSFAALAMKLERLIYRALPESVGLLPEPVLELRLRRLIKRILVSKNIPLGNSNNHQTNNSDPNDLIVAV
ncbi:Aste57867_16188 [Aphanomyces stellatus]|uniref:Aste57867_16188 protein n=1 Tax=Aphanomyces stellatus TaxID=120398 RepID=A0A485L513_9STRA|nr:hypothetical protein As57867_016132 [Aphanomyces stellatus]VFT92966.1 Aste57867_16188 [Aphanomyces stellatus]